MEEPWGSPRFVEERFREWYQTHSHLVHPPRRPAEREYAFIHFGSRGMVRHLSLPTAGELQAYLRNHAPKHAYYSSSYYRDPTADMRLKGWLGADLVFDIDADHFDLPCQKIHDRWACRNCGAQGVGHPPELCTCGKAQFERETWLCDKCLQAAKYETEKLLDLLITDLGAELGELTVNFSGNRGFHVHVQGDRWGRLDQHARREIVDYVMGTGIEAQYMGFTPRGGGYAKPPEVGWRRRVGRALYDYLGSVGEEELRALKVSRRSREAILGRREELLDAILAGETSRVLSYLDSRSIDLLLSRAVKLLAAEVDTVVTTDVHRLIRLANTLHGKTGWLVQNVPIDQLPQYDPLTSAIAFKGGPVKLRFRWAPKIKIMDTWYGPYEDEEATLPLEAALFFLCKNGAKVVD